MLDLPYENQLALNAEVEELIVPSHLSILEKNIKGATNSKSIKFASVDSGIKVENEKLFISTSL